MDNYKFPTTQELLSAGVHFGHSVNKWNPKMEPYIYAAKQGVHVIDLDKTETMLKDAAKFLFDICSKGGQVIFVCTKKQLAKIVADEAVRCGALYMSERWMGGTITNYKVIKKSIDKLVSLKKKRELGELSMYTKKERLLIDREIAKLERFFGGVVDLKGAPSAVFVVDARREKTAVHECGLYGVPIVALIDTNSDPTGITKIIPGNDDAAKSVGKITSIISDSIKNGYIQFEKNKEVEQSKGGKSEQVVRETSSEAQRVQKDTPSIKEVVKEEVKEKTDSKETKKVEKPKSEKPLAKKVPTGKTKTVKVKKGDK